MPPTRCWCGAWLAAALFALHPVHVESVAWITERKNVLSLLFYLLALLAWVDFIEEQPKARWRNYAQAIVFCLLALFSKTTACTLPAALVLVLWLQHKPITRIRALQITPLVFLGLGMGLLTMWWERYHQVTAGSLFSIGWLERLGSQRRQSGSTGASSGAPFRQDQSVDYRNPGRCLRRGWAIP